MRQNAYLLAKIGAGTAENERNFAEILPKTGNYPTGPKRAFRHVHRAAPWTCWPRKQRLYAQRSLNVAQINCSSMIF